MRPSSRIWLGSRSGIQARAYVDMRPSSSIELHDTAYLELSCKGAACVIGENSNITLGHGSSYYVYGAFSMGESSRLDADTSAYIKQYGSLQLDAVSNMTIGTKSSVYVYDNGEISIDKNSNITTGYRSMLHIGGLSVLRLARQTKVELGVSSSFDISYGSKVLMKKPGASTTIGDRAVLSVQSGSVCFGFRDNVVIPSGKVVSVPIPATSVPDGMTCHTAKQYYGG